MSIELECGQNIVSGYGYIKITAGSNILLMTKVSLGKDGKGLSLTDEELQFILDFISKE